MSRLSSFVACCFLFLLIARQANAKSEHHASFLKAQTIAGRAMAQLAIVDGSFAYTRDEHRFYHSPQPLQTFLTKTFGRFMLSDSGAGILLADSSRSQNGIYAAYYYLDGKAFMEMDSYDTAVENATLEDQYDFEYRSAIYTPSVVLQEFLTAGEDRFSWLSEGSVDSIVYLAHDDRIVVIVIDPSNSEVNGISVLYPDDMRGDVATEIHYRSYDSLQGYRYPNHVVVREFGALMNDIQIHHEATLGDRLFLLSKIPATYKLPEPKVKIPEELTSTKYNDHLYFLDLKQAQSRVLLVNFRKFLVIVDAPLKSENGELILKKAHELFPKKPVRYFIFGHHHPWSLGGFRAMVHAGATILSEPGDTTYVRLLAELPHSMRPDALENDPKPLVLETFDSTKVVSDGEFEMDLELLGSMSKHTEDFLMIYFPKDKILFEDDLMGFVKDKPIRAAGDRQKGLYDGILKDKLTVDTIIQNWPMGPRYETIVPFANLEQSVKMMKN